MYVYKYFPKTGVLSTQLCSRGALWLLHLIPVLTSLALYISIILTGGEVAASPWFQQHLPLSSKTKCPLTPLSASISILWETPLQPFKYFPLISVSLARGSSSCFWNTSSLFTLNLANISFSFQSALLKMCFNEQFSNCGHFFFSYDYCFLYLRKSPPPH